MTASEFMTAKLEGKKHEKNPKEMAFICAYGMHIYAYSKDYVAWFHVC